MFKKLCCGSNAKLLCQQGCSIWSYAVCVDYGSLGSAHRRKSKYLLAEEKCRIRVLKYFD